MPELLNNILAETLVIFLGEFHCALDPHAGRHVEGGEGEPVVEDVLLQVAVQEKREGGEAAGVLPVGLPIRNPSNSNSKSFCGFHIWDR